MSYSETTYNDEYSSSSSSGSGSVSGFGTDDFINALYWNGGAGIFPMIIGILFCFFGLKFFKCLMYVFGFCVGLSVGVGLGIAASPRDGSVALILGLLLGICGGYVAVKFRKVIYFIFGFSLGAVISLALNIFVLAKTASSSTDVDSTLQTLAYSTFILGILGGILAVYIGDLIVIITTATSGSFNITLGSIGVFRMNPLTSGGATAFLMLELIAFIALGIWYQLRRREEWKGVLEINNTTVVNTNVNTNVSNENKIEIKIEAPQQPQYGMYPQQAYGTPFIQNPYPQQYPQGQMGQPQQYVQPQQYAQSGQPDQQYAQPQQYSQPHPQQYGQPYAEPTPFAQGTAQ